MRNIFRVGVDETLTEEQRLSRLADVCKRADDGPFWQTHSPQEVFGGTDTIKLKTANDWLEMRDRSARAHINASRELAKAMRQHLRWEAEYLAYAEGGK